MEFLSVVAVVLSFIALVRTSELTTTIKKLEARLKGLENKPQAVSSAQSNTANLHAQGGVSVAGPVHHDVNQNTSHRPAQKVEEDSAFIIWLKEDWLLKLGGILVIMGALFFLSVAYAAVGPQGKMIIGYLFGATLMIGGFLYAKKQVVPGSAVHVIGAVIVLITTYLARQPEYNLFAPVPALLLMFFTSLCVALTSYSHKRPQLAHVGLFMAGIVPILTASGQDNLTGLLVYLGVVTLGVLWLALVTNWRTLILLAVMILIGYSSAFIVSTGNGTLLTNMQILLITTFGVVFFLTSLFSIMRSGGVTNQADGAVAMFNAAFALIWIIGKLPHEQAPITVAVIGLIYAAGFFCVYKVTHVYTSFTVYGSVALGMLTTAVMLQLEGRAETTALLLIGGGVTALTWYLSNNEKVTKTVALFNLLPAIYVLVSIGRIQDSLRPYSYSGDTWKDLFIVVLAIGIYYSLFFYFNNRSKDLQYVALWAGNVVNIMFLWQMSHIAVSGGGGTLIAIILYTIIGLTVLYIASQENNPTKIKCARIWLGLVAGRVVLWDAWQVGDATLSVFICVLIGILLLSSAFIIKKVNQVN